MVRCYFVSSYVGGSRRLLLAIPRYETSSLTATRMRALRDLGLAATSSSDATRGFLVLTRTIGT